MVVGVAPIPMAYVVPSITTAVGWTVRISPSTVTIEAPAKPVALGSAAVVPANPIPSGPMITLCPLIVVVIGATPGPTV
jgi:hypothetical protein